MPFSGQSNLIPLITQATTHTHTHTYRANRKTLMMSTDKHLTGDDPAEHTRAHTECTGCTYGKQVEIHKYPRQDVIM